MNGNRLDVILAGVGGQGILSAANILAIAAREAGLHVKQSEVHGMSQRGGAVQAQLRISDQPIASDLVPRGGADMILSMEPVEGLRYLEYLRPGGVLVTSSEPFLNIPDYPPLDGILERIFEIPGSVAVEATRLAREAGSPYAANVVMVGAASPFIPLDPCLLEDAIVALFRRKGEKVVRVNVDAFHRGRAAAAGTSSAASVPQGV
jgi:indolepyruvate ferredoxin oxidoreductase beta subunit